VIEMTDESRRNLGVERIDLQQFHVWSDAWVADDGWKRAVEDLKKAGTIEGFGISVNRWEPANVLAALETGLVDSVQVVYNVFDQAPEDALFPACQRLGVAVIARVPFDEGSLTGAMTVNDKWPEGDWRNIYFTPDKLKKTLEHVDRLKPLVPAGGSLPDLALRFILHHPPCPPRSPACAASATSKRTWPRATARRSPRNWSRRCAPIAGIGIGRSPDPARAALRTPAALLLEDGDREAVGVFDGQQARPPRVCVLWLLGECAAPCLDLIGQAVHVLGRFRSRGGNPGPSRDHGPSSSRPGRA
jgi:hypothetical protein